MAKKRGRPKGSKNKVYRKPKPKLKSIRVREHELRPMIREAARAGLVEAIEHTSNFWNVSDGYKKYIDHQIKLQSDALMAAVKSALREELHQKIARTVMKRRRKALHELAKRR